MKQLILTGSLLNGFEFFGPFETSTLAIQWANIMFGENVEDGGIPFWQIVPVNTPEDILRFDELVRLE